MSWCKLTFKQLQPIHLGYKKHGVISETRIFITGQTMWGALTNAYYHLIGEHEKPLFENISCFYPMIDNAVLYPRFEDGEFYLSGCSEKEFRQKYVSTFLSTAINPQTKNAKDESLHELDVILPNDIYWIGYINCDEKILKKIKEIYIGGDGRYGLGLMEVVNVKQENYDQPPEKGKLKSSIPNEPISNFVKFEKQKFDGKLELLAEYDFSKNTPKIIDSGLYIIPGSIISA